MKSSHGFLRTDGERRREAAIVVEMEEHYRQIVTVHGHESESGVPSQWRYHTVDKTPRPMDATGKICERLRRMMR